MACKGSEAEILAAPARGRRGAEEVLLVGLNWVLPVPRIGKAPQSGMTTQTFLEALTASSFACSFGVG